MIYFARIGNAGPIKIGVTSRHVHIRLGQLQAASPFLIVLIGTVEGDPRLSIWRTAPDRYRAPLCRLSSLNRRYCRCAFLSRAISTRLKTRVGSLVLVLPDVALPLRCEAIS